MEKKIEAVYEITPLTMAILCEPDENGKVRTKAIEETNHLIINKSPTKIVDDACKFFGSSLKGRLDGTRDISSITHKAPIAIDPSSGMFFFPTASPINISCSWISHSHIKGVKPIQNQSEVTFINGQKILLDVSYGSMLNQIQRTAQFRFSLENRINFIKNIISEKDDPKYDI